MYNVKHLTDRAVLADVKSKRCQTKRCRGFAYGNCRSQYCSKCRTRRWKEKNPLKYCFNKLRNRAKERGHEFKLAFEEYCEFALKTDYFKLKGRTKYALSIHRKDDTKGYEKDNIEALTLSENIKLRFAPKHIQAIHGWQNDPAFEERLQQKRQLKKCQNALKQ